MNDKVRVAIVAVFNSTIPLLQSFSVISLTGDQVAQIMLVVNNTLGLIMLVWKTGQGVDQAGTKAAAEGAAVAAAVAADTVTHPEVPLSDRRGD
jgi:hypothetical protein